MLSIIIVNYKSWDFLTNCLNSFKQYPPKIECEIIVVDNDSEDGKFENFGKQYPEITFIANSDNYGFSHGSNLGAEHSKGKYLLFLNPDTELTPDNAIDTMVNYLEQHTDSGIVSCRKITNHGIERELAFSSPWLLIGWVRQIYKLLKSNSLKKRLSNQSVCHPDWVSGSVLMISKILFNQVGKWNSQRYFMYHEDPDLCNRVSHSGGKITLLRNVTIKHYQGGTSRKNINTAALTKTEVIISAHNYIQENARQKNLLHIFYALNLMLSKTLLLIILLPIFWVRKSQLNARILYKVMRYYIRVISVKSWQNPRLINNEQ